MFFWKIMVLNQNLLHVSKEIYSLSQPYFSPVIPFLTCIYKFFNRKRLSVQIKYLQCSLRCVGCNQCVLVLFCQGCSSWKWYFPYHYAPFASDFVNISDVKNEFETDTKPFKPLEQLMGVFPAASR